MFNLLFTYTLYNQTSENPNGIMLHSVDSIHILLPTNDKGGLIGTFNTCEIHLYFNFLHNCNLIGFHRYHTIDALFFQTEITKQIDFRYIIIKVIMLIFKIIII